MSRAGGCNKWSEEEEHTFGWDKIEVRDTTSSNTTENVIFIFK